jgi:hypothetical protein
MSFATKISDRSPVYFYGVRSEGETIENIAAKFDPKGTMAFLPNISSPLQPGDVVVIDFKASTISIG